MATDMLTTYQFSDGWRFGAHGIACVTARIAPPFMRAAIHARRSQPCQPPDVGIFCSDGCISLFGQGKFAVPIGRELGATHWNCNANRRRASPRGQKILKIPVNLPDRREFEDRGRSGLRMP
jgi:hypothetical protein